MVVITRVPVTDPSIAFQVNLLQHDTCNIGAALGQNINCGAGYFSWCLVPAHDKQRFVHQLTDNSGVTHGHDRWCIEQQVIIALFKGQNDIPGTLRGENIRGVGELGITGTHEVKTGFFMMNDELARVIGCGEDVIGQPGPITFQAQHLFQAGTPQVGINYQDFLALHCHHHAKTHDQ